MTRREWWLVVLAPLVKKPSRLPINYDDILIDLPKAYEPNMYVSLNELREIRVALEKESIVIGDATIIQG